MWQERKAVGHLAKAAGSRALVINYRLAPEDKFPAQIDDVEAAYRGYSTRGTIRPGSLAAATRSAGTTAVNLALTLQRKNTPLPGRCSPSHPGLTWSSRTARSTPTKARQDAEPRPAARL